MKLSKFKSNVKVRPMRRMIGSLFGFLIIILLLVFLKYKLPLILILILIIICVVLIQYWKIKNNYYMY